MLSLILVPTLLLEAAAHGRLKDPPARSDSNIAIQDRPLKEFACRSAKNPDVPPTQVNAGEKLTIMFDLDAQHPGDASLYLSYDHDVPYETIDEMEFFKIANIFDAQARHKQPFEITLPDWLPGGNAVLRWEWYALHENPNVEFWTQCSDLVIKPTAKALPLEKIPTYRVVIGENARTLPLEGPRREEDELKKYRKVTYSRSSFKWENPSPAFITGPECALGFAKNDCRKTAVGTQGHVDVWHKHAEDDPNAFSEYKRPTLPKISQPVKMISLIALVFVVIYNCMPARKKAKDSYEKLPQLDNLGSVSESQRFNLDYDTPRNHPAGGSNVTFPTSVRRRSVRGTFGDLPRFESGRSLLSGGNDPFQANVGASNSPSG